MDLIFVAIGISIHVVFLFKREMLFDRRSFSLLLAVSVIIFALSYMLHKWNLGQPKTIILLKIPMLTLLIFFLMKTFYFKIFRKNPRDTFWSMDIELMRDGIFNALFWIIGLLVPIILVYEVL